ncbi:uncharacterized protein K02A2.6-like [Ornithodoros turicata]|uniref:uncharacterized protein K02A2.6-like n=1 Tax=Ornithodoros turicata TaxID=34597 RepID=UPI0031397D20
MDLFSLGGKWWLVITDYYSRFPEIAPLEDLSSKTVIHHCQSVFARHGIPDEVMSDNGPQFSGAEFKQFAQAYKFTHITSSPRYPQSNGLAEAAVKIIKNSLKKTGDPYETLLVYRSSPLRNGFSPSQLLMGRRLRTTVPTEAENLLPETVDYRELKKREEQMQHNSRHGVRRLPPIETGEKVWIVDLKRTGIVSCKADTPRSY